MKSVSTETKKTPPSGAAGRVVGNTGETTSQEYYVLVQVRQNRSLLRSLYLQKQVLETKDLVGLLK